MFSQQDPHAAPTEDRQLEELRNALDFSCSPRGRLIWPVLVEELRRIEYTKTFTGLAEFLDHFEWTELARQKRGFRDREGLMAFEESNRTLRVRFLEAYANGEVERLMCCPSSNQGLKPLPLTGTTLDPANFFRALLWGRNVRKPADFLYEVQRLISTEPNYAFECTFFDGGDDYFQLAMAFVRTMKERAPEWIKRYPPIDGLGSAMENVLRYIPVVEQPPLNPDVKQVFCRSTSIDFRELFEGPRGQFAFGDRDEIRMELTPTRDKLSFELFVELTKADKGYNVKLFKRNRNGGFRYDAAPAEQIKINLEILNRAIGLALEYVDCELVTRPTVKPEPVFDELFIFDRDFNPNTGFLYFF